MNNDPNNHPMVDAVAGQPASRRGFRGCTGFAVQAVACVALLFAGPLPSAEAQTTRTWNNNVTTGSWSGTGSWLGGVVPTSTTDIAAFSSTNPGLVLTATGAATPSIGQLYFDNAGTTTLQLNQITLNSGTGIIVTANSGNVFISSTSLLNTTTGAAVIIGTNQIWENNSTSGTLSVQRTTASTWIRLNNSLTIKGSGRTELGQLIGTGNITKQDAGTLLIRSTDSAADIGTTTVSGGTLQIGDGTNTVSYRSSITNNAAVIFDIPTSASTTYSGIISGNGALTKQGAGTLTLNGANTFTGTTTVSSGTLIFDRRVAGSDFGQFAGDIVNNATVVFGASNQNISGTYAGVISGNGALTKHGAGKLTLTGANTFTGTTTIIQGSLDIGNGGTTGSVAGNIAFGGNSMALTFNRSNDLTYGGTISAVGTNFHSNTFTKLGSGKLTLTGSFEVSGAGSGISVTVSNGVLEIGNGGTAGSITRNITNNATVAFNRSDDVTYAQIISGSGNLTKLGAGKLTLTGVNTFTGTTTVSAGILQIDGGSTVGSGTANLVNNATVIFNRSSDLTYSGTISGNGNLTKLNTAALTLSNANTFSGTTTVSGGRVTLGNVLALQNSGIDTAGSGTITASSNQTSLTIGGLIGSTNFSSVFTANLTGVTSLTLNPQAGRSYTYSGTIANVGTRTLTKTGAGEQILSAVNTYTGLTTVSAGRLTIGGGNINASSGVTVNGADAEFRYNSATAFNKTLTLTQGILSGTGTIQTAVTVGSNATISPGNSPGSQTYDSSVWQAGGTYLWEVKSLTGTAGTDWDRVVVTNALNLSALSASSKFNINLTTLTGSDTNGPLATPWTATGTSIFPFVSYNTLSVGGTFSNTANSDLTALFNFDLTNWVGISGSSKPQAKDISVKVNSTGNGLNLVIVPEPATIALAGIGIGTAVWFFRRRRAA